MKKTAKKLSPAILPPSINKGDTIGLVAPAGPLISKDNFLAGVSILENQGFRVSFNKKLLNRKGYLAGSDQERADEFNNLWSDPEVKALVAARGGYGCLRMLDMINMTQIRKKPKILVGFSDLTVLLAAINKKARLITYHGPVVTTLASIDKKSKTSFFNVLNGSMPPQITSSKVKVLREGKASGFLMGGNLTTLVHMVGTRYEIPWHEIILFIEDIGESAYRLDRLLTHLHQAGRLQKINGLVLGTFTDDNRKEKYNLKKAVNKRVTELLGETDIPVLTDFPIGHSRRNITLPIGLQAELDTSEGSLLFPGHAAL